jgi:hypothetical protein
MARPLEPGARVIYRVPGRSTCPARDAKGVYPAPHGEDYSYYVEKFWTVTAVLPEGKIIACTKRGKQYTLRADDPALRAARWWERLLFAKRFPRPARAETPLQYANGSESTETPGSISVLRTVCGPETMATSLSPDKHLAACS